MFTIYCLSEGRVILVIIARHIHPMKGVPQFQVSIILSITIPRSSRAANNDRRILFWNPNKVRALPHPVAPSVNVIFTRSFRHWLGWFAPPLSRPRHSGATQMLQLLYSSSSRRSTMVNDRPSKCESLLQKRTRPGWLGRGFKASPRCQFLQSAHRPTIIQNRRSTRH